VVRCEARPGRRWVIPLALGCKSELRDTALRFVRSCAACGLRCAVLCCAVLAAALCCARGRAGRGPTPSFPTLRCAGVWWKLLVPQYGINNAM